MNKRIFAALLAASLCGASVVRANDTESIQAPSFTSDVKSVDQFEKAESGSKTSDKQEDGRTYRQKFQDNWNNYSAQGTDKLKAGLTLDGNKTDIVRVLAPTTTIAALAACVGFTAYKLAKQAPSAYAFAKAQALNAKLQAQNAYNWAKAKTTSKKK